MGGWPGRTGDHRVGNRAAVSGPAILEWRIGVKKGGGGGLLTIEFWLEWPFWIGGLVLRRGRGGTFDHRV